MSFYETSISHPRVVPQRSGQTSIGVNWVHLAADNVATPTGVWVRNDDSTNDIYVKAPDSTTGITHGPGEDRFYPVFSLHDIQVSAAAGGPTVSWWLG